MEHTEKKHGSPMEGVVRNQGLGVIKAMDSMSLDALECPHGFNASLTMHLAHFRNHPK